MDRTYNPCDECPYGIDKRDGSGNDSMCKICEFTALLNRRAAPENKPLTNLEALFGTPEKIADVLLPMLPTMEGFCQYCKHWNDGECKVNPHWDCKNALINWLKSKPEQEEK